ncbi:hypothetical protein [Nitrospirillum iridis]|uniref:Uncharacterized protein n=1 Tax=Nitrospirillum iridis TaxID=765888 RepID=A0A7X0EFR1_9PROT|nr:hypothetical protein [Nitrospirillum iridis]MBB6255268.1 hypothetical protein [Nitrospirillum iridis]
MNIVADITVRPPSWLPLPTVPRSGAAAPPLAGMALIAQAMGLAARREGQGLLSNPFESVDAEDAPEGELSAAAWRDGWLAGL